LKKKLADNIYSSVGVDDEFKDTKQAQVVFSTLAMYTQLQHVILSVGDLSDHNKEKVYCWLPRLTIFLFMFGQWTSTMDKNNMCFSLEI
jgi:hypothetical protein